MPLMDNEMAKKTREEMIAEANKSNKPPEEDTPEVEEDPPLSPEAKAEQDRILGLSEEQIAAEDQSRETDPPEPSEDPKLEAANAAIRKLRAIFLAYAPSAPNEHICFGNGGGRFTLGEFRDLMKMMPPE